MSVFSAKNLVMARKSFVVYSLWIVVIKGVGAFNSESLDLVEDCCAQKCGRLVEPLYINSDGLDKKSDQFSALRITMMGERFPENGTLESYCLIYVSTLDYAMLNLTYYLDKDQTDDIVRVSPNIMHREILLYARCRGD